MKDLMRRDTLFMAYPSTWWHDLWREGLVSGNGFIGANVYGGVKEETTMLTNHDLWHMGKQDEVPDVHEAFGRLREKMDEENFREASWEVVNELKEKGYQTKLEAFLLVADLKVNFASKATFFDYVRFVHMDSGEVGARWREAKQRYESTLFVSRKEDMIVKRIRAEEGSFDAELSLDMHWNEGSTFKYRKEQLAHITESKEITTELPFLIYTAKNDDGRDYGAVVKVLAQDGKLEKSPLGIHICGASEVLILAKLFVKEEKENAVLRLKQELNWVEKPYDILLEEHRKLHGKLYRSADLTLGNHRSFHNNEALLAEAFSGRQSAELVEKLWRYGRYLFISGTNEGANPFPLYGLWGGEYSLMWCHNMANENTQMIYWHSSVGNLLDYNKALFSYYNHRIPDFQKNAERLFGMRGIYMTAGTTPGVSAPNQVVPVIMNWVGAAGWIAQHYYSYYRYTQDAAYLEKVLLPYLEKVADFYEDFITFDSEGKIYFYPSVSPENTPENFMPPRHIQMAHPMPTTVNSTIDLAIVKEFFTNMCAIAEETGRYADRVQNFRRILKAIPEYRCNEAGAIREWQDERFEDRHDHRHLSHIYPVFPGYEVNVLENRELLPAFRKAVELREIDAQTGWSMAHMAAIYARLEDGEKALECLNNMEKSCLINNFFTLHNDWRKMNISLCMDSAPVQLDAIMGYVNAVQEMLLYSSEKLVKLLPALPKNLSESPFAKGRINNFRYVHGSLDMHWEAKGEAFKFRAELRSLRNHDIVLKLPEMVKAPELEIKNGSIEVMENNFYRLYLEKNGRLIIKTECR